MIIICAGVVSIYQSHRFTPEKWRDHPEKRVRIVSDLMKKYELVGMSEDEVLKLLGPETYSRQTSFKGDRTYYPPDETLVYYIGDDWLERVYMILSLQDNKVAKISFGVT